AGEQRVYQLVPRFGYRTAGEYLTAGKETITASRPGNHGGHLGAGACNCQQRYGAEADQKTATRMHQFDGHVWLLRFRCGRLATRRGADFFRLRGSADFLAAFFTFLSMRSAVNRS